MIDQTIHIARRGEAGPRVVMIHGGAQGTRTSGERHFSTQLELADQGWSLVIPDRPGHGLSANPGRPDDAEAHGVWASELLGDGAHLVGHSFGGCVALAAAARRPEAVRSLTLIEPGMQLLAMNDPRVRKLGMRMLATIYLTFSPAKRAKRFADLLHIPNDIRGGSDADELSRMGRAIARLKPPSKAVLERELGLVREQAIPLLVATGGWSPGFDVVGETVAAQGGGRHVVIRSAHHFPQLTSKEFNSKLTAFMREAEESPNLRPRMAK
jgi:pimeloyl-ACP methyl ester carboxylesterase